LPPFDAANFRARQADCVADRLLAEAMPDPGDSKLPDELEDQPAAATRSSIKGPFLGWHRQIVAEAAYPGLVPNQSGGGPGSGPVATG
jgi:hypothetical protein